MINERILTPEELAQREVIINNMKKNKRKLVKKYGKDAEKVMYGRATNVVLKQSKDKKMDLKEMVKDALTKPITKKINENPISCPCKKQLKEIEKEEPVITPEPNPIDTITMDIPLFIRMLEFAKEDAKTDMDLHKVTERATSLGVERGILVMEDYDDIIGDQAEIKSEPDTNEKKFHDAIVNETFKRLVGKIQKQGKSKEDASKIAGSIAAKKMKGAGTGPTKKQIARTK